MTSKAIISWNGLSYTDKAKNKKKLWNTSSKEFCRLYSIYRLAFRKNIEGTLKALAIVRAKEVENWEYFIGGMGESCSELKKLTKELKLIAKAKFLGFFADRDIGMLYRKSDLFLHPQIAGNDGDDIEGFGLVIVDAMSFGILVIAGIDGAPKEYLENDVTGFLVNGNNERELAEKLIELIGNVGKLQQVGERGRKWALSNLTWECNVAQL